MTDQNFPESGGGVWTVESLRFFDDLIYQMRFPEHNQTNSSVVLRSSEVSTAFQDSRVQLLLDDDDLQRINGEISDVESETEIPVVVREFLEEYDNCFYNLNEQLPDQNDFSLFDDFTDWENVRVSFWDTVHVNNIVSEVITPRIENTNPSCALQCQCPISIEPAAPVPEFNYELLNMNQSDKIYDGIRTPSSVYSSPPEYNFFFNLDVVPPRSPTILDEARERLRPKYLSMRPDSPSFDDSLSDYLERELELRMSFTVGRRM